MKLRNKKTGDIIKDAQYRNYSTRDGFVITTSIDKYPYKSLKEFVRIGRTTTLPSLVLMTMKYERLSEHGQR